MTAIQAITLFSFAMFSLVDLRVRVVPLIEVFFGVAVFLAFPDDLNERDNADPQYHQTKHGERG